MSRIGKKPVIIPSDILVSIYKNKILIVKGVLVLKRIIHPSVILNIIENRIHFSLNKDNYSSKMWSYVGTYRSIVNSLIKGINNNFEKRLSLVGVGYKAFINDNLLILNLGFSHAIEFLIPKYVEISCVSSTEIVIKSYDKQLVGQIASKIRLIKPPESYKKGKGIRYLNENVRIKEHKKKTK